MSQNRCAGCIGGAVMKFTKLISISVLSLLFATSIYAAGEKKVDPETGLILAKGFEEIKTNCTVCHSASFILLQRGDRQTWKEMVVWMQETQGLWQFDPKTEDLILTYLSTNYAAEDRIERRKNLHISALPKNPYRK